jgi:hypothetical protein
MLTCHLLHLTSSPFPAPSLPQHSRPIPSYAPWVQRRIAVPARIPTPSHLPNSDPPNPTPSLQHTCTHIHLCTHVREHSHAAVDMRLECSLASWLPRAARAHGSPPRTAGAPRRGAAIATTHPPPPFVRLARVPRHGAAPTALRHVGRGPHALASCPAGVRTGVDRRAATLRMPCHSHAPPCC